MDNLIMISVMLATIAIPAMGARMAPRRGVAFTVVGMSLFLVVYFGLVLLVMPRFFS